MEDEKVNELVEKIEEDIEGMEIYNEALQEFEKVMKVIEGEG